MTPALPAAARAFFDRAYATDLVFEPDCWKLCGDAHCCSFSRHKARFEIIQAPQQELPLLPGEWAYLVERGWNAQFGEHTATQHRYELDGYTIEWTSMVSQRPMCACDHGTRTVVCRLYPLLPTFASNGNITGTAPLGMYEELEILEGLPRACRIDTIPTDQHELFLDLAGDIAAEPVWRFALIAYTAAKRHVFDRLAARRDPAVSAFKQFEMALFRKRLFDHDALRAELQQALIDVSNGDIADLAVRAEQLHAADRACLSR